MQENVSTVFRLLRNTFYLSVGKIVQPLISFFLVVYISRLLGVQGLGEYSTTLAILFFFEIFAKFGYNHLIVRGIAEDNAKAGIYFTTSVLFGGTAAIIVTGILQLIFDVFNYPQVIHTCVSVLAFSLIFTVFVDFWGSIFEGLQRMEFKTLLLMVDSTGRTVFGIGAIYFGYGVVGLMWAIVGVRILTCLIGLSLLRHLEIKWVRKIDWKLCVLLLKQSFTFLLISLVARTYWKIDVVMLSKMQSAADVGMYSSAYRLVEILKNLAYAYLASIFPIFSSTYYRSMDLFKRNCMYSIRYLFMLTFPIAVGVTILAGDFISLIYGEAFTSSARVLQVLIWMICLFPIGMVFARALVASHNQKYDLICNLVTMFVNVSVNVILIPRFSYIGAAVATLISLTCFLCLQYLFFVLKIANITVLNILIKPIIAGCLMGAVTLLIKDIYLVLNVFLSAVVYSAILILMKSFSDDEIGMMKQIWQHKILLIKPNH